MTESYQSLPAQYDPPTEVEETLKSLLDPPATVFSKDFFTAALYTVQLLYKVALFYNVHTIVVEWYNALTTTEEKDGGSSITIIIWLCLMLRLSPLDRRPIINYYKSSRFPPITTSPFLLPNIISAPPINVELTPSASPAMSAVNKTGQNTSKGGSEGKIEESRNLEGPRLKDIDPAGSGRSIRRQNSTPH